MNREAGQLEPVLYSAIVRAALAEDLGRGGDLTTGALVPAEAKGVARIVSREPGRVAGLEVAVAVFRELDPEVEVAISAPDGSDVVPGDVLVEMRGAARALLTAERTALNLLAHLSGVATVTRKMVEAVAGTDAVITCTRKTTPGLRVLEKYAVRVGGGRNHRFGLDDAVLIKDNHLPFAGGVGEAVRRARESVGHLVKIEVEVETLNQLEEALDAGVDVILLDNMPLDRLRAAVARAKGLALLEASGGVDVDSVSAIAHAGVDLISSGALTHSAPALDLSMDLECDRHSRSAELDATPARAPVA